MAEGEKEGKKKQNIVVFIIFLEIASMSHMTSVLILTKMLLKLLSSEHVFYENMFEN